MECSHLNQLKNIEPSGTGCADCLKAGDKWVHLRICKTCGYVGCCNNSKNKHAAKHFEATGHPIMQSFEPNEKWGYCFIDKIYFKAL